MDETKEICLRTSIYDAIIGVMEDVGSIGKDSKNAQQGFMYRGIDAVMNALQPALIKRGVFVVPEVVEQTREERTTRKDNTLIYSVMKIKYHFVARDGSEVAATVIGEGMDSGDKASNKAMSVAFKYACFQVFCIPTEEMVDPDSETPEPSKKYTIEDAKREAQELGIDLEKVANYYKTPFEQLGLKEIRDAIRIKRERSAR